MSISILIILITISLSLYALNNSNFMYHLIFSPYVVYTKKQFIRFISSGFIHADLSHLIFNMLALYSFGEALEHIYAYYYGLKGKYIFLILYLGGIVISNIPSFFKNKKNPNYLSLGASGGVSAVVFSGILFSPGTIICAFYFICLPGFLFGILYIIYSIYSAKTGFHQKINHWAHLTGALYGIIFNIILMPKIIPFFIIEVKKILFTYSLFN